MPGVGEPSAAFGFPTEIEISLRQVRDLCLAIIEAACGSDPRAKDVSDRFGLHAKLGWQLWSLAKFDPLTAYRFLPNEHGMKVWRQAAVAQKVPMELFDRLEDAIGEVRRLVEVHAVDHDMFEMLVDAQAEQSHQEVELKWRKQAFLGNSFMFGARAKCMLSTAIIYPCERPHRFGLVRLHGLLDLVRTRIGVRWPICTLVVEQPDGTDTTPKREPLIPAAEGAGGVPFLTKYSSQPLPAIERRSDGEVLYDELLPGLVGLTGAVTVFTGEILHDVGPTHGMKEGEIAHFGSGIRTPVELLVSDHIVHRSIFPDAVRELRIYSELSSAYARDDADRLHVSEELQFLGYGLGRVRTADVPEYAEILTDAFERIGADANDFAVYRIRMRYPPIPASAMVRHALPPPP